MQTENAEDTLIPVSESVEAMVAYVAYKTSSERNRALLERMEGGQNEKWRKEWKEECERMEEEYQNKCRELRRKRERQRRQADKARRLADEAKKAMQERRKQLQELRAQQHKFLGGRKRIRASHSFGPKAKPPPDPAAAVKVSGVGLSPPVRPAEPEKDKERPMPLLPEAALDKAAASSEGAAEATGAAKPAAPASKSIATLPPKGPLKPNRERISRNTSHQALGRRGRRTASRESSGNSSADSGKSDGTSRRPKSTSYFGRRRKKSSSDDDLIKPGRVKGKFRSPVQDTEGNEQPLRNFDPTFNYFPTLISFPFINPPAFSFPSPIPLPPGSSLAARVAEMAWMQAETVKRESSVRTRTRASSVVTSFSSAINIMTSTVSAPERTQSVPSGSGQGATAPSESASSQGGVVPSKSSVSFSVASAQSNADKKPSFVSGLAGESVSVAFLASQKAAEETSTGKYGMHLSLGRAPLIPAPTFSSNLKARGKANENSRAPGTGGVAKSSSAASIGSSSLRRLQSRDSLEGGGVPNSKVAGRVSSSVNAATEGMQNLRLKKKADDG